VLVDAHRVWVASQGMQWSSSSKVGNQEGKQFHWLALPSTLHMVGILAELWHKARKKRIRP